MLEYSLPQAISSATSTVVVDYVWIDGSAPTNHLRSKNRTFRISSRNLKIPDWGFDGSSTNQAEGDNSDLVLKPVQIYISPFRRNGLLVMCEVEDLDGTPHATNHRSDLKNLVKENLDEEIWFGFEQEYTLMKSGRPLGWPDPHNSYTAPQNKFYCGVGADEIAGRKIVEKHLDYCLTAGINIFGTNAEVMLGQWEFQIGPESSKELLNKDIAVMFADDLWMARYILYRLAEEFNVTATLDVKPIKGDWNGSGCHTNFSTKGMRDGTSDYKDIIAKLGEKHREHIKVYGEGLEKRLTGMHETCEINTFKAGVSDRTASIRIPPSMAKTNCGYLEDRRPGANCDPYAVAARIMKTIFD